MMKVRKIFMDEMKEEQWLNEMSKQGWHFKKYSPFLLTYTFEQDSSKVYTYRVDCVNGQKKDYFEFVESTGAELVYKNAFWAHFRKDQADGDFELYTDNQSKLSYLNRLQGVYVLVLAINFLAVIMALPDVMQYGTARLVLFLFNVTVLILFIPVLLKTIGRKNRLKEDVFEV